MVKVYKSIDDFKIAYPNLELLQNALQSFSNNSNRSYKHRKDFHKDGKTGTDRRHPFFSQKKSKSWHGHFSPGHPK